MATHRYVPQAPGDWRTKAQRLIDSRAEFKGGESEMDRWTAHQFYKELTEKAAEYAPAIEAGAIGEFKAAQAKYKAAQAKYKEAEKAEAARYDLDKYAEASKALTLLLNVNAPRAQNGDTAAIAQIEKLANNIIASKDPTRISSLSDTLRSTEAWSAANLDFRVKLKTLGRSAEDALKSLQNTPEIQAANAELVKTAADVMNLKAELALAAEAITGRPVSEASPTNPIEKAMRQVAVVDGQFTIYDDDDWHVTGVLFHPDKESNIVGG